MAEHPRRDDPRAAEELIPLVYAELQRLATQKLAAERPGQTLQAMDLVHEAYLRLAGKELAWDGPRHFLFAAARAMHDILVEGVRQRASLKVGGGRVRLNVDGLVLPCESPPKEVIALSEAMVELERQHPRQHRVVFLRFFAGCTADQTAEAMQVSSATIAREWRSARAWLHERLMNPSDRP